MGQTAATSSLEEELEESAPTLLESPPEQLCPAADPHPTEEASGKGNTSQSLPGCSFFQEKKETQPSVFLSTGPS